MATTCLAFTLGLAAATPAIAANCDRDLDLSPTDTSPEMALPRDLKLTPDLVNYLNQTNRGDIPKSLAKIFALNDEQIVILTNQLNTPVAADQLIPYDFDLSLLPAKYQYEKAIRLYTLLADFPELNLQPKEIGMLAGMMSPLRADELPTDVTWKTDNSIEPVLKRLDGFLWSKAYRSALSMLLMSPGFREELLVRFPSKSLAHDAFSSDGIRELLGQVEKNKLNKRSRTLLAILIDSTALSLLEDLTAEFGDEAVRAMGSKLVLINRQILLRSFRDFYATKLVLSSSLDDVVDLASFLFADIPLPLTPTEMRASLIEIAKTMLLPIKAEYAKSRQNNTTSAPVRELTPYVYRPVDVFAPRNPPSRRSFGASVGQPETRATKEKDPSSVKPELDSSLDLRQFTTYVAQPRSLSLLSAEVDYQTWFMRENTGQIKTLRLTRQSLGEIEARPELGRQLLNAFHMGKARIMGETGIKRLRLRSRFYDEPIYELKVKGGYRGILVADETTWTLVMVVPKDDLDARVTQLTNHQIRDR